MEEVEEEEKFMWGGSIMVQVGASESPSSRHINPITEASGGICHNRCRIHLPRVVTATLQSGAPVEARAFLVPRPSRRVLDREV